MDLSRKILFTLNQLIKLLQQCSSPVKHPLDIHRNNPSFFLPCPRHPEHRPLPFLITHEGFTLIEILVVIVILGTLSSIAVPGYSRYIDKVRIKKAILEIKIVEKEILGFHNDNNRFPDSLADIGRGNFLDPWGNPYRYYNVDANGVGKSRKDRGAAPINDDYDLYSIGKDGESKLGLQHFESQDDIVRADEGRFLGLASEF